MAGARDRGLADRPSYQPLESLEQSQSITYVVTSKRGGNSNDSNSGCGCLIFLIALVAIAIGGYNIAIGHGDRVLQFLTMDRPGYGVHVCTTEHYALDRVECDKESAIITNLSDARLAISKQNALVANTLTLNLYRSSDMGQICATSLSSTPGVNNIAFHLDQVIAQCGAHLKSGTNYEIDIAQDTEALGTATFTYGTAPASVPVTRPSNLKDLYKVVTAVFDNCAQRVKELLGRGAPATSRIQSANSECMLDSYVTAGIVVPPRLRSSTTLQSYLHHAYAFEQAAVRFSAEILSYRNGRASYARAMIVISRLARQINSNSNAVFFWVSAFTGASGTMDESAIVQLNNM